MFSDFDRFCMTRALKLAERGFESTHPNPRVGCVIARNGQIIAEGWHQQPGEPHAEINALRAANESVAGATAYTTLEPCSHHGRTPPCTDALIQARLGRVVFAVQDPNPQVSGAGATALREAGIQVESGLMEAEAVDLNVGFMKRMRQGLPWVRVKLAMSLDGRTALAGGASRWITGEAARLDVQSWRARSSAVLTGIGTILADDPQLNVRGGGEDRRQPVRVVLDSKLRTPPAAQLFGSAGEVLVLTSADATAERAEALAARGAQVEIIPGQRGMLDLAAVLARLGELEMNEVLVEAGSSLAGALLAQRLVDELLLYVAPKLLGPQARPLVLTPELSSLQDAWSFSLIENRVMGADLRLRLIALSA